MLFMRPRFVMQCGDASIAGRDEKLRRTFTSQDMRRHQFLFGLGAAGVWSLGYARASIARATTLRVIRVHLFSGLDLQFVDVAGIRLDASSAPMAFSPQGGPISVSAAAADGSTFARHYAGSIVSGKV